MVFLSRQETRSFERDRKAPGGQSFRKKHSMVKILLNSGAEDSPRSSIFCRRNENLEKCIKGDAYSVVRCTAIRCDIKRTILSSHLACTTEYQLRAFVCT